MPFVKATEDDIAAMNLTPAWGSVPTLSVGSLRKAGVKDVPAHWDDQDSVSVIVDGISFFIMPTSSEGLAYTVSMNGVDVRLGLPTLGHLTDEPRQNYWSEPVPWVDGYVPAPTGDGRRASGVRQFLPLRGQDKIQKFDVATLVGADPMQDGITVAYYLPRDLRSLVSSRPFYYGGAMYMMAEAASLESGARALGSGPEQVGMAAGGVMRQYHPDKPGVYASDYQQHPFLSLTTHLVWPDQFNAWANALGEQVIKQAMLEDLERQQKEYAAGIYKKYGVQPNVTSNVNTLPMPS
jgi:hypothetical protein